MIDLDDPRQVQTGTPTQFFGVLIEGRGVIGVREIETGGAFVTLSAFGSTTELDAFELPGGLEEPWAMTPISDSEIVLMARTADFRTQSILKLDLQTRQFSELHRHLVNHELSPWFGHIEVRGTTLLLSAPSDIYVIPGPPPPISNGRLLVIELDSGAQHDLFWPQGGGPYSNGAMLAAGFLQSVPAIGAGTRLTYALLTFLFGAIVIAAGRSRSSAQ